VRLTWAQVEALVTVAAQVDAEPATLDEFLPERAQRMAFRGAVKALQHLHDTTQAVMD